METPRLPAASPGKRQRDRSENPEGFERYLAGNVSAATVAIIRQSKPAIIVRNGT
jgi:hypothetical protein